MLLPPPRFIDDAVSEFCLGISPEKPINVPVQPSPSAVVSHCFDNVADQIKTRGGDIAYGWAIWHWPGVYFEAEHHGIWRNPKGDLVDVTPGLSSAERILFLPDKSAVYDPSAFRSNVLAPVDGNELAAEFVSLANALKSTVDQYRGPGVTHPQYSWSDNIRLFWLQARMTSVYGKLSTIYPPPSG